MKNLLLIIFVFIMASCSSDVIFEEQAGNISIAIDTKGRIVSIKDVTTGMDYIAKDTSFLISCGRYGTNDKLDSPISAQKIGQNLYEFAYPENVKLTVSIKPIDNYFRLEIVKVEPISEISQIKWGPYYTNMQNIIGNWLGIVRSDDCSIGILSLEPNTDSPSVLSNVAQYTKEGASLELYSFDHTRGVFRDYGNKGKESKLRHSEPIKKTVQGSAIALYSSKAGYNNELDAIEKIVLKEGLPHPTINSVWNKRSREQTEYNMWSEYTEENFDEYLKLTKTVGARVMCKFHGYFKNWGHFDIDLEKYPSGITGLLEMSQKAKKYGIGTTLYSLTTFIKPITDEEPYLSPIPDPRLQTLRYEGKLSREVQIGDDEIVIENNPDVLATVKSSRKICIDHELIEFEQYKENKNTIILSNCKRGLFYTDKQVHKKGVPVKFMFFAGFNNFYPGTIDMTLEMSDYLFNYFDKTDQSLFITDGFESCLETGYGCYTNNLFADNFYKRCLDADREIFWTGSNFSNYSWHHYSHMSWGEFDWEKGFRGSMLDYRISRQVLLGVNLMPKKLGQYYPDNATVSDIEWLMGFATGWDSGIDFVLNLESFKNNPDYNKIVDKLALWTKARKEGIFTEEQLRALRQTDREYTLSQDENGSWNLDFVKYWRNENVKVLPSSNLPIKSKSKSAVVKPCSIDWFWTHNPAVYYEVVLSDDMVHTSGMDASEWQVYYPQHGDSKKESSDPRYFQFVIRLPEDAPCAVKDIKLSFNNSELNLPVTLQPGEYLTMPHLAPIVCVYNKKHELVSEKLIRGIIPYVHEKETATVKIACSSVDKEKSPSLIMNLRTQHGVAYINYY